MARPAWPPPMTTTSRCCVAAPAVTRHAVTSKLNIMPLSWCSAMWQCAIQRPTLVTSRTMSTVSPVRTSTVSLHTRFGSDDAVAGQDEEPSGSVDVERVVHRVVGVHLVDEPDLHAVADAEVPVDRVVLGVVGAVDELPAHVRRRRELVDLDHVVFPLDAARVLVAVPVGVRARDGRRRAASSWPCPPACDRTSRAGMSFMPHSGQRSAVSLVTSGCIGQAKPGRCGFGDELHPALGQRSGLVAGDLGVHRAGVDERAAGADVGLAHVHLGHERQRLVRRRVDQRREPLALGAELGVGAQDRERLGQRRRRLRPRSR